jgi:hypothetical protein
MPVPSLDNYFTEVDADAHLYALLLIDASVALCHPLLDRDRAFNRIEDARELGQQAITHELEDATMVFLISGSKSSFRCARRRSNVPASSRSINAE